VCCATEFWERFSYYGMRSLLVFYLMQHFLFTDAQSYLVYGAYTAMVYMTPVVGGFIADRYLGARRAVMLGAVLLVFGHLGMAFEGPTATQRTIAGVVVATQDESSLQRLYLSLALIATGVGFLKSNTTALVGSLYEFDDPGRQAGFTTFYMVYNVGSACAPLLCGWLGSTYGWSYGFGLAALGMLVGLLAFWRGQRYLLGRGEPPDRESQSLGLMWPDRLAYAAALGLVVPVWLMLRSPQVVGPVLSLFGCMVGALILYYAFARCTRIERDRLLICAILITFTIGFWAFYEQQGSSLNVFAERLVDRMRVAPRARSQ
jgi:proton-dependent oligopeptide transporter, POT family